MLLDTDRLDDTVVVYDFLNIKRRNVGIAVKVTKGQGTLVEILVIFSLSTGGLYLTHSFGVNP